MPLAQWSAAQTALRSGNVYLGKWSRRAPNGQGQADGRDFLTAVGQVLPSLATSDFATVATQLADLQARQQASQTQSGELASLTARLRTDQRAADEASRVGHLLSTRNLRSVAAFMNATRLNVNDKPGQQRTTWPSKWGGQPDGLTTGR